MAANASENNEPKKDGAVRYYVTTDTHGYAWGYRNSTDCPIDFDLGDNTCYDKVVKLDPPEIMSVRSTIALRGNHDTCALKRTTEQLNNSQSLQIFRDTANKIVVYGLDSCTENIEKHCVPLKQIKAMADDMQNLDLDWDVIILSHVPLFDGNTSRYELLWPDNYKKPANAEFVHSVMYAFTKRQSVTIDNTKYSFVGKNGNIIGCFAGHIHGHIKTTIEVAADCHIPAEVFTTNGAEEWSKDGQRHYNAGLYIPYGPPYINVNFATKTMNGIPFRDTTKAFKTECSAEYHSENNCFYKNNALGCFNFNRGTSDYFPKFWNERYTGYSTSRRKGVDMHSNAGDGRYWVLDTVKEIKANDGSIVKAKYIWFNVNGLLRYVAPAATGFNGYDSTKYKQIANYNTAASIQLEAGGVIWQFVNGLLKSVTPPYKSGVLQGKNGWVFYFDSQGKPYGMTQNGGTPVDYGAGENWMNVHEVRLFNEITAPLTNVPQIGATGTFSTGVDRNDVRYK